MKKKKEKVAEQAEEIKLDAADQVAEEVEETSQAQEAEEVEEPKELTPEEKIEALEAELAEEKDKLLRQKADFQNYRMRMAKEVANARVFGQTDTIMPFLQVFDHFSMAMAAADKSDNMDAIKQGLDMILNEYEKGLEELGVKSFSAIGEKFDPKLHEAMANEPSDEVEEGYIIKQWNAGYKMGERLLRPATVIVSSGPAKAEESEEQ